MQLGRVIGTVVATTVSPGLEGVRLLVVQPVDRHREPLGRPVVAADAVAMAGPGELVYFVAAREAAQAMEDTGGGAGAGSQLRARGPCRGGHRRRRRGQRRRFSVRVGRVVATVVSTVQVEVLGGRRLLLCDLLGLDGTPAGRSLIAVDAVGAGAGETVLILDEGNSARQVLGAPDAPIRAVVVGIVDAIDLSSD